MNIPLSFWFNKDYKFSIPICALPFHHPIFYYPDDNENNIYDIRVLYGDEPISTRDDNLSGTVLFKKYNDKERELYPILKINFNFDTF